jgi:hypothetical protein
MLTDRLGRAFQRLGLRRVPKDATVSLVEVLARHRAEEVEAAE